jgi:hypothetical protein
MKNTEGTRKAAMSEIEIGLNIEAIPNLEWTSASTGDGGGESV